MIWPGWRKCSPRCDASVFFLCKLSVVSHLFIFFFKRTFVPRTLDTFSQNLFSKLRNSNKTRSGRPLCTNGRDLWRLDQIDCKFRVRRVYGHKAQRHPSTPPPLHLFCYFPPSCQNLSRKISSHLKSKAFSKFFNATDTQKKQWGRFIRNRKKAGLKESLFPLWIPSIEFHRFRPQPHPLIERKGNFLKLPFLVARPGTVLSVDIALGTFTMT